MGCYVLIEFPFNNELICGNLIIDLNTLNPKRNIDIYIEDKVFNCSVCLFKEKYIAYVSQCEGRSWYT